MASELDRLCRILVQVINERDFEFRKPKARELAKKHISPDWQGRFDNEVFTMSFADQIEVWRQLSIKHPCFEVAILDLSVDMHKDRASAAVLMRTHVTEHAGVLLQGICETRWKLRDGRWIWWYHHAMKGLRET